MSKYLSVATAFKLSVAFLSLSPFLAFLLALLAGPGESPLGSIKVITHRALPHARLSSFGKLNSSKAESDDKALNSLQFSR